MPVFVPEFPDIFAPDGIWNVNENGAPGPVVSRGLWNDGRDGGLPAAVRGGRDHVALDRRRPEGPGGAGPGDRHLPVRRVRRVRSYRRRGRGPRGRVASGKGTRAPVHLDEG